MSSDLLGIDAAAVGGLIAAAPANAADAYVALSYSLGSKVSGMAVAGSEAAAGTASLQNCQANGGGGCVTYVIAHNSCAAIAIGTDPTLHQEWSVATHSVVELARKQALSANGGGIIGASGCTTSQPTDPHGDPPQSPPSDTPPTDPTPPPPADPVEHDYDHDGLSKHDELFTHHTNPLLADTDFDGINDKTEITNGTNPRDPRSH